MNNKELKIKQLKKEVNAYKEHIETLEKLKPIMKEFDNKVLNKKFFDRISDVLNDSTKPCTPEHKYNVRKDERPDVIWLVIFNYKYNYSDYYGTLHIPFNKKECFVFIDGKKPRIIASKFIEALDGVIQKNETKIETLEDGINKVDDMLKEAREIIGVMKNFYNSYNSTILEVFECDYKFLKGIRGLENIVMINKGR